MKLWRLSPAAEARLDDIAAYTESVWGRQQAIDYFDKLVTGFEAIAAGTVVRHPIPASFGVGGYRYRVGQHIIYWQMLDDGVVGIVTILHVRTHQIERFRADFALD
ncbi:type II toxin-antitoxin system RelE/ParE family toxin [Sandaracinobacteroides saxicola]|uniref:Type II toxin-antitoxin system RelE/ParE family toxin n=1 Tax=Sandaracinobacteroides saxicola TaxID=2759707 RepID=A0A7G5ILN3_9SPHN|nr:type II toxin-antitoxin system RelE/ParE family toxin [Sandaracinobacteroides saxicola]QMW24275.1 type II toxin-antitoxin system RelE/ParE family toxin [Sandaracinobacteroides saxicola]